MAPRNSIPNPVPASPNSPPPTANPGAGRVWAYNYQKNYYESMVANLPILQRWPYTSSNFTPGQTPGTQPPPGGIPANLTPAQEAAYKQYYQSRIGGVTGETVVEEDGDGGGGTPMRPGEKIDWEAIVAAIEVNALQAAKELYGGYYAIIEGNEEIKKLILDAYTQKWTQSKFLAKLRETEWWATTDDSARKFDINEQLDAATVKSNIAKKALQVQEMAMAKGVRLSEEVASRLARESLRLGWDEITLANSIGAEIVKLAPTSQVSQGFIGNQIRSNALDYGIRLSDASFSKWTEQILTGKASDQIYKDYLLNQAKTLYPSLSDGFDRGLTFKQMTDPYAEQASRILELPTSQIDFTDAKWATAIGVTDKAGGQRMMTFSEWDRYLKTNPAFGFEYTDNARNQALDLVGRIGRLFGAA